MLKIFFISIITIFVLPSSARVFLLRLITIYFYYLSNINFFFCSPIIRNLEFYLNDEVSLFITFLLFFIIYISYVSRISFNNYKLIALTLLCLFYFCFEVFNTCHLFSLYFFYEASLIPILYIIIKWGSYPERSVSAIIIISYTLLFGVPIFILISVLFQINSTWFLFFTHYNKVSSLRRILIFCCFAVKLPIYGLHYWLPIAHVEAPTFGSVILARILLKLGGVGLIRLLPMIDLIFIKSVMLSYLILFTIFSTIVCCFQSDFKRLIAYSSVSHIIVIPFLVFRRNLLSLQSLIIIILFHGLSSSLIFFSVGILYRIFRSRQLILLRGIALTSPFLRMLLVLTFFYTLSAPPFPSYIAEVYFILSTFNLSPFIVLIYLLFAFLGIVYNLNWLRRILFNSRTNVSYESFNITYFSILPFLLILLITFQVLFITFNI